MEDSEKGESNTTLPPGSNSCWNNKASSMEEKSNNNEDDNNCANVKPNICKVRYNRIFKKVSSDGNLVLFLPQRELSVSESNVESLMGVALIHENIMRVPDIKVFLQVVLVFR